MVTTTNQPPAPHHLLDINPRSKPLPFNMATPCLLCPACTSKHAKKRWKSSACHVDPKTESVRMASSSAGPWIRLCARSGILVLSLMHAAEQQHNTFHFSLLSRAMDPPVPQTESNGVDGRGGSGGAAAANSNTASKAGFSGSGRVGMEMLGE
eukprot:scaffold166768_cov21-Tisochrysis_lutea.AAC.2